MRNLLDPPPADAMAQFREGFGPRFILTVDTEEEFDWARPLDRKDHGVAHVGRLAKFQEFAEGRGVVPVYLIDWPIATSERAAQILAGPIADGRAEIGVQLHPWVNPPFEEEVTQDNSFAGNLPIGLERSKLNQLRNRIEENFSTAPLIYRAGRYGVGPATAGLLADAGIAIDTSVRPHFDYSSAGGPSYLLHPLAPYWLDDERTLLELPLTTVFWGMLRRQGPAIYPRLWRVPAMRGVLSHMSLLERIPLTPEGVSVEEAIKGIDIALDDGLPLLAFSFHSPSLQPGHTPYVRSEADLDHFYDWWRRVFDYLEGRGVRPASVRDVMGGVVRG